MEEILVENPYTTQRPLSNVTTIVTNIMEESINTKLIFYLQLIHNMPCGNFPLAI
jgi:hypothetical protein